MKDISRRSFLKIGAAAAAAVSLPNFEVFASDNKKKPLPMEGHKVTPVNEADENIEIKDPGVELDSKYTIVDSHLHYTDFLAKTDGFPALCKAMDKSGVAKAVIFGLPMAKMWDETMPSAPTYYLSNDSRCYYYSAVDHIVAEELIAQPKEIRDRFFPFCCGVNMADRFAADQIERLLKRYPNFWCGIGELMSRHDDLTALTYGEAPHVNSEAFKRVFDLAARENLPVIVHHNVSAQVTVNTDEKTDDNYLYVHELEEALAHNRQCHIIWAHVGISRRIEVRGLIKTAARLLRENPNLWIDISWVVYDYYFLDAFPSNYYDGDKMQDWVDFIEEFPDRIMIGTDKVGHWKTYPDEVVKYYKLLDLLKPETVSKICRDNILGLVKR